MGNDFLTWLKAAGIRAIKTFAQTAIATIATFESMGSTLLLTDVNWRVTIYAASLAAILSLLTSAAGLPELKTNAKEVTNSNDKYNQSNE